MLSVEHVFFLLEKVYSCSCLAIQPSTVCDSAVCDWNWKRIFPWQNVRSYAHLCSRLIPHWYPRWEGEITTRSDVCHQTLMEDSFRHASIVAVSLRSDFPPIGSWTGGAAGRPPGDLAVFAAMFANTVTIQMSAGVSVWLTQIILNQFGYSLAAALWLKISQKTPQRPWNEIFCIFSIKHDPINK